MTLQNRVTPLGDLIADPARGLVYGNRGCLHDDEGRIHRRYATRRWIACRLEFKGWKRTRLLQPGRFTELFFLDEATAFAAGHRPCALCRREDYDRFGEIWSKLHPGPRDADTIDRILHVERLLPKGGDRRVHPVCFDDLPDGAFVLRDEEPHLVLGDQLLRWTPAGYRDRAPRPAGEQAQAITPPSLRAVLRTGWDGAVPLFHPSALEAAEPALRPAP
jgi:hypothetical protein